MQAAADHEVLVLQLCLHPHALLACAVQPRGHCIIRLVKLAVARLQCVVSVHENLNVSLEVLLAVLHYISKELLVLQGLLYLLLLCELQEFLFSEFFIARPDVLVQRLALQLLIPGLLLTFFNVRLQFLQRLLVLHDMLPQLSLSAHKQLLPLTASRQPLVHASSGGFKFSACFLVSALLLQQLCGLVFLLQSLQYASKLGDFPIVHLLPLLAHIAATMLVNESLRGVSLSLD
mmetsp:Transcript_35872/g.83483  ORF Transcript_35872/g.83483 Transcript_35872/m.83483 type:complete len:233 (-) Transcript_35872:88-786(-)